MVIVRVIIVMAIVVIMIYIVVNTLTTVKIVSLTSYNLLFINYTFVISIHNPTSCTFRCLRSIIITTIITFTNIINI